MEPHPQQPIVVIGAGVSGLLTAIFLAEAGYKVTVLEKKVAGNGSTLRSAACIRAQWDVQETALGMAWAERYYARFHDEMHTPDDEQQQVISQNGYLFLYDVDKGEGEQAKAWEDAQRSARMQQNFQIPVEILAPSEVATRWPHIDPGILLGATWCPSDGFLYPTNIVRAAERRAKELGVTLRQYEKVVGARHGPDGQIEKLVVTLKANGQTIELPCGVVVNATNAWGRVVSESMGGTSLPIDPVKRYLYFMHRAERWSREAFLRLPMTIYGTGFPYSRPENADQLMFAMAHKADPEHGFRDDDQDAIGKGFGHREGLDSYAFRIIEQIYQFAPTLIGDGEIRVDASTAGYYGQTPDHTPIIGVDPQVGNLVHAAGFSGHGLMHAPYTALLVRRIVSDLVGRDMLSTGDQPVVTPSLLDRFSVGRDFSANEEKRVL